MGQTRISDMAHQELLNWSRWCWQGPLPHPLPATQCGSGENQYRTPPDWNPEDEPTPLRIRANEANARKVQSVYDGLSMDGRLVLKAEYPCRHERGSRQAAAGRIGISLSAYEHALQDAVNKVEAAFEVCA